MKGLKSFLLFATVTVGKAINFAGRFLLEVATAIGLLACANCTRMGISANIHAASDIHMFPETYWSCRNEQLGGIFVFFISVAVALFVVYWRYAFLVDDNDTTAIDDTAVKILAGERRETQTFISFMHFLGFIITSIIWTITTLPMDAHWDDVMMGEVIQNSAIAVPICVVSIVIGRCLSSFYSEEKIEI